MELHFVAKNNVEIPEVMQNYARRKIEKLSRYLPSIGEGKVEISREETKSPEQRFTVQVTLDSKGMLIRAQEKAEDMRTAIDKIVGVLTNRIERYKGKLYDKGRGISSVRHGAAKAQESEIPRKVVRSKHFLIKPMSLDEARDQMDLLGHDFFLFINAESNKVNLLYRRRDGNYGLIELEIK
jgi:putative sigma-54 modulation protein